MRKSFYLGGIKITINEYGFLGKDIKKYESKLETQFKDVFKFYEDFNHYLNIIQYKIVKKKDNISPDKIIIVAKNDIQGATIYTIFLKSLTTFQSIYILFRHCFCNNAENLSRILFEEMVNIYYCSLGEDVTKKFRAEVKIQEYYKNKTLNKIMTEQKEGKRKLFSNNVLENYFKEQSFPKRQKLIIDELEQYNVKDIFNDKHEPKKIKVFEKIEQIINQKRDLGFIEHHYRSFYYFASNGIHISPSTLDEYFILDNYTEEIKDFRQGPEAENCDIFYIINSIYFMILIIDCLSDYFKYPKKEDISIFRGRTKELINKYQLFLKIMNN